MVICFLEEIKQELDKSTELIVTTSGKNVLKRIQTELLPRFNIKNVHVAASLLDPALKNVSWMADYLEKDESGEIKKSEAEILKHFIDLFEITSLSGDGKTDNTVAQVDLGNNNSQHDRRLKLLSNIGIKKNEEKDNPSSVSMEIENYFKEPLDYIPSSTLEWWNSKRQKFPHLAQLFTIFLSIPPTSSSSEVAFSKSGKFLKAERSVMAPSKVNKFCFINSNVRFLEVKGDIFVLDNICNGEP